ncbi:MAG TPA: 2-oxoglutarate dehydrogenase complex dihydrolipoyllysine-residue succinyltransferase [Tepidisphaeraceae bacterium]|jgi:2-oxoglutarate dehydrogenase E2 component (dihydrolipoamide succinyltransferase)
MATSVTVPNLGDSVTQATLLKWHKQDGESVKLDEPLCELETDKANVDVPATAAGVFTRTPGLDAGAVLQVGQAIASIDPNGKAGAKPAPAAAAPAAPAASPAVAGSTGASTVKPAEPSNGATFTGAKAASPVERSNERGSGADADLSPAVRRMIEEHGLNPAKIAPTGPGGRLTKEDVIKYLDVNAPSVTGAKAVADVDPHEAASVIAQPQASAPPTPAEAKTAAGVGVTRTPMSKLRKRIAENLVRAQQTAAILTTFNEVDLTNVMALRTKYKEKFEKSHGVGLGFMSFFSKAVCMALKEFPRVNGQLDGDDVITFDYVNLGIAVSTERGLAVPVLRNADKMSFAKIESEIKRVAGAVREGKLGLQELSGGTFTITNGGVFGSLLSTPILNSPQSGILGMHTIQKRPMVVGDKIEARPMMYIALSYDHRLVDGRESVSFLVRIKDLLEDPSRLLLEV